MRYIEIFPKLETTEFCLLTKKEYLANPILSRYKYLPRISVSLKEPQKTTESERMLVDVSDQARWKISKSQKYKTTRGTETFDILEKIGPRKFGKQILCLNYPFEAYLDSLPKGELRNQKVLIINPGITEEVISQNNNILHEVYPDQAPITDQRDAIMSRKNQSLLLERGAVPFVWDHVHEENTSTSKLRTFLEQEKISGIILNGGSMPSTGIWLAKHWSTVEDFLFNNPLGWCAHLCAPIYILNPGPLRPSYEADSYKILDGCLQEGFGFFGPDVAVLPHFRSRNKLSSLRHFYHSNTKIVIDIPDKGIFIY